MFGRIFDVSSNAMAFTEAGTGRIVDVNATWLRATGVARERAIGRTALELGLWPDATMREACLAAFQPDGRLADHEMQLVMLDGLRTVIATAEPVALSDGDYVLWEFRDITERKRAEQALQASERKFRAIFDQTFQFTGLLDTAGCILEANEAVLDFAGESLAALVGRPLWTTAWWSQSTELQERLRDAVARAADGEFVRFVVAHTDAAGHARHIDFSLKPVRGASGRIEWLIPEGRDVTLLHELEAERAQLHERMQQAQKLESLGILAGGIAHDFNNLLTVVLGNASLVAMELPAGSPAEPLVEAVLKASRRATELAQQLLAYAGRGALRSEALQLDRIVSDTCNLLRSSLPPAARLQFELAQAPAVGDPTQWRQVVMNLVLNAAEALGGHDGVITVRTGVRAANEVDLRSPFLCDELPPGDYAFVEVQDTGQGMDEATMRRIFEPFFTTKPKGRGLGLSAVLGIVRGHRGSLRVDSRPGQGTRFSILLPAQRASTPVAVAAAAPAPAERLLVVDDEDRVLTFVCKALESCGYRTLSARDGREGLAVFDRERATIDGAVLDLAMPHLGGAELLEHIRTLAPTLPVLVTSGYSTKDALVRCRQLGAGFLPKPFDVSTLFVAVKAMLRGAMPRS
jgi:PAS domain S-box-containing protein